MKFTPNQRHNYSKPTFAKKRYTIILLRTLDCLFSCLPYIECVVWNLEDCKSKYNLFNIYLKLHKFAQITVLVQQAFF